MRTIDADELYARLMARYTAHNWDNTLDVVARAAIMSCMEAVERSKTITISPSSNDPLTMEELREMGGEPVWVERHDGGQSEWAIVGDFKSLYGVYFATAWGGLRLPYDEYGETWLACRRKPEEGII